MKDTWKLFIDGASRNNPGPSGAGIVIIKNDILFIKKGFFLNRKTNNQAEYLSLIIGLYLMRNLIKENDIFTIISDSQLLVRQIKGDYKIKNDGLKPLFYLARELLSPLSYSLLHVLREENKEADFMANYGLDQRNILSQDIVSFLRKSNIHV